MKNISEWLRECRDKSGKSVTEVSDELNRLHNIKKSSKTIYGYENGHSMPDAYVLLALCKIYGVDDILSELGYNKKEAASEKSEGDSLIDLLTQRIGREPSVKEMKLFYRIIDGICEYLETDS